MKKNHIVYDSVKLYGKNSIFHSTLTKLLYFLIIPFSIASLLVFSLYEYNLRSQINTDLEAEAGKIAQNYSNIHQSNENYNRMLCANDYVKKYLTKDFYQMDNSEIHTTISNITLSINPAFLNIQDLYSITIYSEKNDRFVSSKIGDRDAKQIRNEPWYNKFKKNSKEAFLISDKNNVVYCCYPVYINTTLSGCIVFTYDSDTFVNILSKNTNERTVYITDYKDNLIYSNSANKTYPVTESKLGFFNKKDNYIYKEKCLYSDSIITLEVPKSTYRTYRSLQVSFMLVYLILLITSSVSMAYYSTTTNYKSILSIINMINKSNKNGVLENTSLNEIKFIENYIQNTSTREENQVEQLKQAQLQVLQSQINPHFLFNTLNMINTRIIRITKSDTEVSNVITSLAEIMRSILDHTQFTTTFSDEIEYVNKYMYIIQTRFRKNISIIWNIPSELKEQYILKMILQPIIENAFNYGLKDYIGPDPTISISCRMENQYLLFTIANNGKLISKDMTKQINQRLKNAESPSPEHIGLLNINKRIKIFYGNDCGIVVGKKNNMTVINIKIKVFKQTDNNI